MQKQFRLLAAVTLGLPAFALAGPSDYVRVPAVEYGEREIDIKYGTEKMKDSEGGERESAGSLGFGYGATPWWFTEAYVKYEKEGSSKTKYDAFEWENKFQLTETNKYFADVGFFVELEVPKERHEEGYEIAFGPLFQFDTGPLRWNLNPVFEKLVHSRALLVNIDYPLGMAAYHHLSAVALGVDELRGIYIMGKAATLKAASAT